MRVNYEDQKIDVLMSIKTKYVDEIKTGSKKYEFRKRIFKKDVRNIYIYETYPVKKIVAYFEYEGFLCDTPLNIWGKCKNDSGIDKEPFLKYFGESSLAFAIKINNLKLIDPPLDPKSVFSEFTAPQSYMYIPKGCLEK